MVKCSAVNCGSASYRKTPEITFHRFPKDENLKNLWLKNMKRTNWQPATNSVLCSKHFAQDFIDRSGFRAVLTTGAIPTIFEENMESAAATAIQTISKKRTTIGDCSEESKENAPSSSKRANDQPCSSSTIILEIPKIDESAKPASVLQSIENQCQCSTKIKKLQRKLISKDKTLKALREQKRRLKKKVETFADIIKELRGKLNNDDLNILSNIPTTNKDFLFRYLKKSQNMPLEKSYSPELRSFALQLNFFSPRSYNFVRTTFNTILPHPVTLRRWYKKVDAEPGFTAELLNILENIAKQSA